MRPRSFVGALFVACACAGCAHGDAVVAPSGEPAAVARLHQQNAALRRRVQLLEDRTLRLEQGLIPADVASVRALPVVRLEAEEASDTPSEPPPRATMSSRSVTLAQLPNSGAPAEAFDDDSTHWVPGPEATAAAAHSGGSYRLVGSRLVELTQTNGPKRPDRKVNRGDPTLAEYDQAMELYKAGELGVAQAAFDRFARTHPRHDYADNAIYWRGEASYDQAHFADALAAFTQVVEEYGGGNKAPDALLKIGLCYAKLGDKDNARDVLDRLVSAYPSARASTIARRRLDEFGG